MALMPPANWQANFQQGFREVSQRFQSGAMQFQQMMQQSYNGAQNGFQNAASRASTAIRGYSTRFNNGGYGGGGNGFAQMSSTNPQFSMDGNNGNNGNNGMTGQLMNRGYNDSQYPKSSPNGNDDTRRCTTKTMIGLLVIILILALSGGGAGLLFSLNDSKQNSVALGAASDGGRNDTGNVTDADADPLNSFNIELVFLTSATAGERLAFEQAKAKWQQVVTGDLKLEAFLAKGRTICGLVVPEDKVIDDLLIFVEIAPIDGVNNILGSAAPCGFDRLNFPRVGIMSFDNADSAELVASGQFQDVVLHEMGHVLGLGTLWDYPFQLLTPPSATNPTAAVRYLGRNGNAANVEIGGPSQAIVENLGGPGTARGHWKDSVYQNELMTGFLSEGNNPMSRLTISALADLGYIVDPSKADQFAFPSSGRRLRGAQAKKRAYGNDVAVFPRHQLPSRSKGAKERFSLDRSKHHPIVSSDL